MITLHAGESNGALVLWGEASGNDGVRSTSRRRGTKAPYVSPYPFAASADGLAGALEEIWLGLKPAASPACHVTAWLPTRGDSPVPSSTLIAELPGSRAKARLAPWTVAAYRLSTAEAVELLCASIGKRTLAAGVIVGADLAYWAEALRLAGSMVARQQFLPGLTTDTDEHRATWDPVFIGMDAERLAGLARCYGKPCRILHGRSCLHQGGASIMGAACSRGGRTFDPEPKTYADLHMVSIASTEPSKAIHTPQPRGYLFGVWPDHQLVAPLALGVADMSAHPPVLYLVHLA